MEQVFRAASQLHAERHAPELPIPVSAIERYANRFKLSGPFVQLVHIYDTTTLSKAFSERGK